MPSCSQTTLAPARIASSTTARRLLGLPEDLHHVRRRRQIVERRDHGLAQDLLAGVARVDRDHPVALLLQVQHGEVGRPHVVGAHADRRDRPDPLAGCRGCTRRRSAGARAPNRPDTPASGSFARLADRVASLDAWSRASGSFGRRSPSARPRRTSPPASGSFVVAIDRLVAAPDLAPWRRVRLVRRSPAGPVDAGPAPASGSFGRSSSPARPRRRALLEERGEAFLEVLAERVVDDHLGGEVDRPPRGPSRAAGRRRACRAPAPRAACRAGARAARRTPPRACRARPPD